MNSLVMGGNLQATGGNIGKLLTAGVNDDLHLVCLWCSKWIDFSYRYVIEVCRGMVRRRNKDGVCGIKVMISRY